MLICLAEFMNTLPGWRSRFGIAGLTKSHDCVEELAAALAYCVDHADEKQRLELIVSHPDLAGRAAQRGELTAESSTEQASAGIDQCNEQEFQRFQQFNAAYKEKFNFPL